MQFSLQVSLRPNVFVPYSTHGRNYYLLFHKFTPRKTKIWVTDSSVLKSETFFQVGDLHSDTPDGDVIGNIFYTPAASTCYGSAIMAYSKVWAKQANSTKFVTPVGVNLHVRSKHMFVYHKKNEVTVIVNPSLPASIRFNLEI